MILLPTAQNSGKNNAIHRKPTLLSSLQEICAAMKEHFLILNENLNICKKINDINYP